LDEQEENPLWIGIEKAFCREKGLESIAHGDFAGQRVQLFMKNCSTADWLDILELVCKFILIAQENKNNYNVNRWGQETSAQDAIVEINYRLRQACVGYQFEGKNLIRTDSEYIHAEIVKPALVLLNGPGFDGPRAEFLEAHSHYRAGENRQAVGMAASAVESTLKTIFDRKGWRYQKGSRISDLLKVARANNLWPDYLDNSFDQLVATLQSGLPKIRDNDSAHGQGANIKEVPNYIAAYALHLAASKIVFIYEAAR
jgi:hypothetical protein